MILAAGRGERLRPLTDRLPKALIEVAGRTLIEANLERLARAGVERVVVNLGWLGEMIAERVGDGAQHDLQVVYSPEYDRVLETGGGISRALPLLGRAPFWLLNADVHTDFALPVLELEDDCLAHLVLVPTPEDKPRGDFDLVDGRVRNAALPAYTYSGIGLYRPELFAGAGKGRFPLAPLLVAAADRGRLTGEVYRGLWEDVGTPERLARLTASR
jgi:N-acetyl-alpha-D-muramate 1-phosphate uridylyltransferase